MTIFDHLFVILLGVVTVFVGLACIIGLCLLMNYLFDRLNAKEVKPTAPAVSSAQDIPNRQELVAAVAAAVAEELGTSVSAIRILSLKKL